MKRFICFFVGCNYEGVYKRKSFMIKSSRRPCINRYVWTRRIRLHDLVCARCGGFV